MKKESMFAKIRSGRRWSNGITWHSNIFLRPLSNKIHWVDAILVCF